MFYFFKRLFILERQSVWVCAVRWGAVRGAVGEQERESQAGSPVNTEPHLRTLRWNQESSDLSTEPLRHPWSWYSSEGGQARLTRGDICAETWMKWQTELWAICKIKAFVIPCVLKDCVCGGVLEVPHMHSGTSPSANSPLQWSHKPSWRRAPPLPPSPTASWPFSVAALIAPQPLSAELLYQKRESILRREKPAVSEQCWLWGPFWGTGSL